LAYNRPTTLDIDSDILDLPNNDMVWLRRYNSGSIETEKECLLSPTHESRAHVLAPQARAHPWALCLQSHRDILSCILLCLGSCV
jgi:hypothetical protein